MYEFLSQFAQIGGMLLFVAAFILILIYALSPGNKKMFDKASRSPLESSDHPLDPEDKK